MELFARHASLEAHDDFARGPSLNIDNPHREDLIDPVGVDDLDRGAPWPGWEVAQFYFSDDCDLVTARSGSLCDLDTYGGHVLVGVRETPLVFVGEGGPLWDELYHSFHSLAVEDNQSEGMGAGVVDVAAGEDVVGAGEVDVGAAEEAGGDGQEPMGAAAQRVQAGFKKCLMGLVVTSEHGKDFETI